MEEGREKTLQAASLRIGSQPDPQAMARFLISSLKLDDESATNSARQQLEKVFATTLGQSRRPQRNQPINVVDRLDELTVASIKLVTVGPDAVVTGAVQAISDAIAEQLPRAQRSHVRSAWGSLLPLGEPRRVADLIAASTGSAA